MAAMLITITGGLAEDATFTPKDPNKSNSRARLAGRIVHSDRRLEDDEWVDGPAVGYNFAMFGSRAENLAPIAKKGAPLLLVGELTSRFYESAAGDQDVWTEIVVTYAGVDAARAAVTLNPRTTK